LYFWTACERYHSTIDQELRCAIARDIYAKHLACDAIEPVNVDSKASNLTIEQIEEANPNLFLQACLLLFCYFDNAIREINKSSIKCIYFRHKNKYLI